MSNKYIYLVGPIGECSVGEANDWRHEVMSLLPKGIVGVSPLRCEPLIGEKYEVVYDDPRFGTANAIAAKNEYDTRNCDMVLAFMPKFLNERRPSYGSTIELAWAHMLGKQVILVSDDEYLMRHPLINAVTNWRLETLSEAMEVIEGVLGVYSE